MSKRLTDFQLRVLEETLKIPFGQVRSYGWIARRLGRAGSVRAVGSALKNNPYPLLIPCHRVVKADGQAGGYSRGKGIKKRLLRLESQLKNAFSLNRKKRG